MARTPQLNLNVDVRFRSRRYFASGLVLGWWLTECVSEAVATGDATWTVLAALVSVAATGLLLVEAKQVASITDIYRRIWYEGGE